jgi:hypothetical protein
MFVAGRLGRQELLRALQPGHASCGCRRRDLGELPREVVVGVGGAVVEHGMAGGRGLHQEAILAADRHLIGVAPRSMERRGPADDVFAAGGLENVPGHQDARDAGAIVLRGHRHDREGQAGRVHAHDREAAGHRGRGERGSLLGPGQHHDDVARVPRQPHLVVGEEAPRHECRAPLGAGRLRQERLDLLEGVHGEQLPPRAPGPLRHAIDLAQQAGVRGGRGVAIRPQDRREVLGEHAASLQVPAVEGQRPVDEVRRAHADLSTAGEPVAFAPDHAEAHEDRPPVAPNATRNSTTPRMCS